MKNKIILFSSDLKYSGTPMSLLSITCLLDTSKYDIHIITYPEYPGYENEILKHCQDALCFGISCITGKPIKSALAVSKLVKEKYPDVPIIWGGWQAITLPDATLNSPYVDYLCTGQGERTFYEFINMIENNNYENIGNIHGLSYKKNRINIHNPKREIEDLNNFPDFDLNLINWEKYLEVTDFGLKTLRIVTSYGCPNHCRFCCEFYNSNGKWKALSAERIIRFLNKLRSKVGFDSLIIGDSNFFVYEKRVIEFCTGLINNNFNIRYGQINGTTDILVRYKEETWKLLQQTGLHDILIGAESANNETLKFIGKRAVVEDTYRLSQICKKYGINLIASVMIGTPIPSYFAQDKQQALDKEFKELTKLYKDLYDLNPDNYFVLFFYTPLPSTPLYNKAVELGFVPPKTLDEWSDYDLLSIHFDWITKKNITRKNVLNYTSLVLSKNVNNFNRSLPWVLRIFTAPTLRIVKSITRLRIKFNYYGFPLDYIIFEISVRLFHRINRVLKIINIIDPN